MSTSQPTVLRRLRANLDAVRDRLARAASSAGRSAEEVRLLPVTKSVSPEVAAALVELLAEDGSGPLELAENRLEGLDRKRAAFEREGLEVCWHFIGHLQRNKARRVVRAVDVVHSVDSLRLAETLARVAEEEDRHLSIYLQVNCTGEEAKHGMAPDDLGAAIEVLRGTGRLQLLGLMAMGPLEPRPGYSTEEVFARVAALAGELERTGAPLATPGTCALSMGMSADLEAAVEAGSTCVRIGSDLFRELPPSHGEDRP